MDSHTAIERVGKINTNIGEWRVEECLGRRRQRKYLLLLWYSGEIDTDGLQFTLPRVTIYRAVCERLEAIERVTDAIECFDEMMSGLGGEVYLSGPMTEWVSGEFMFYLVVCRTFNVSGQISPTDVSQFPEATVRRQRRPPHHF